MLIVDRASQEALVAHRALEGPLPGVDLPDVVLQIGPDGVARFASLVGTGERLDACWDSGI